MTLLQSYHYDENAMRALPVVDYPNSLSSQHDSECVCPKCNGPVVRVRRRFVDRLLSLVKPTRRYRCFAKGWGCDWEGNLP